MKYGDFSSVVQLGVGLNLGTAVLQLYGDIGLQPMVRILARIRRLATESAHVQSECGEELEVLEGEFEVFKIRLFNEYRFLVFLNAAAALLLVVALLVISFAAEHVIPIEVGVVFSMFSILPAPITLGILWSNASSVLEPLMDRARSLQSKALSASSE